MDPCVHAGNSHRSHAAGKGLCSLQVLWPPNRPDGGESPVLLKAAG